MREHLFEDSLDMPNVHETISLGSLVDAQQTRESLEGKHVCPYCGAINESASGPCPNCSLENTPAGRKATKSRIGPWYVLQRRNPAAPGMKYDMLLNFVRKGRVKPRTVVRGPTTHQMWRFAAHIKGLSREFGLCYSCGEKIEPTSTVCPLCNRLQLPPMNPDALLESGESESPPGGTPMVESAVVSAPAVSASNGAMDHSFEPEGNDDIVVPALTDRPGEPAREPAAPVENSVANENDSVADSATAAPAPEPPATASASLQSMALATVGMQAIGDAPVGARARSAALKAGTIGQAPGPRVVPLAGGSASPSPVLTVDSPKPVARYRDRGRWRGAAEMVLFLVVVASAIGGAVLLADVSLREEAQSAYDRVLKAAHLKSDAGAPTPNQQQPPAVPTGAVAPAAPTPAGMPRLESDDVTKPAVAPPPAPPIPLSAAQAAAHTEPAAVTPLPPPAVSPADATDDTSIAADQKRAKELYLAAFAAAGRHDWATAADDYRQILKLPKSVQYSDVESRLRVAEAQLAKSESGSH